jgi:hypothetical protein
MRPPQYRLESTDSEIKNGKTAAEMSNLLGPASCSNCAPTKTDQYPIKEFKCVKSRRSLIPQQTPLFPTSGSGEELIIQDLDASPALPFFETTGIYYPKEVDQLIHNAMFIAHHIG